MALVFPTPTQAAAQNPVNTFSPSSTPLVNTSNGFIYTYLPAKGVWIISGTTSGSGSGTVTSITAGPGLLGGTITTSGTISLPTTGVTAAQYTNATITVDAYGRITLASSGTAVSSVAVTAPITNTGTVSAPVIGINLATINQIGAVQLNDTTTSTSDTLALTAKQGKNLQDQINSLLITSNLTLAGTFDAAAGSILTVTSAGTAAGFTAGSNLPAPVAGLLDYFVIVTTPGTYDPPGPGGPYTASQGDWFLCDGTQWQFLNVGPEVPTASTAQAGIVELADNTETQTGTDGTRAVTPAGAAATYVKKSLYALKGDILAGTSAASTPAALALGTNGQILTVDTTTTTGLKWINAAPGGVTSVTGSCPITVTAGSTPVVSIDAATTICCGAVELATVGEVQASSDNVRAVTPLGASCTYLAFQGPNSRLTAKGSLISACAASTPCELTVGTDNQVLVACSTATTGLCWKTVNFPVTATPTAFGLVLGCTTSTNSALGCNALLGNAGTNNVAVGCNALCAAGLGINNVAVGGLALSANAGGNGNTGIGASAMAANTSGLSNTSLGAFALSGNTSGCFNTALGSGAGSTITTGNSNVVIGVCAQVASGTASCQLAIGFSSTNNWLTGDSTQAIKPGAGILDCTNSTGGAGQVLMSNGANAICWGSGSVADATPTVAGVMRGSTTTTNTALGGAVGMCGQLSVYIGGDAAKCSSGLGNVAIGYQAGPTVGTLASNIGSCNVMIGLQSGCKLCTGNNNTVVGACTATGLTTGCLNTFLGYGSGIAITTSCYNTLIGSNTGSAVTGSFNTVLGANAGISITTGASNIVIGSLANVNTCANNNVVVGATASVGTGCNNVVLGPLVSVGAGSCNIFIGNSILGVNAAGNNQVALGAGTITASFTTGATNWTFTSDARDKADIEDLALGLDFLQDVQARRYTWDFRHTESGKGAPGIGFVAQELQEVVKKHDASYAGLVSVFDEEGENMGVSNGQFIPILINAVKELSAELKTVKAELAKLKRKG